MLLPVLWIIGAAAGYVYALQQNIPLATALRVLPAFLLEVSFFYVLGSERLRARIEKWPPVAIAIVLTLAALAPYTIAATALGSFGRTAFFAIAGLAAVVSFWYVLLPHKPAADVLFLVLMGVVMLARVFPHLYVSPIPKLQLPVLGQAMWIRTGAFAMLSIRRVGGVGFGFWPNKREWKIGALFYLAFLAVAIWIAWWIGFGKPRMPVGWEKTTLYAIATFFGILWVVAMGEEFFFRGLLQQWITRWLSSSTAGLIFTSLLFGAVHLWFRTFPNWRFAVLAAIAGIFYGLAFQRARSIRASMVAHALVVTTWRIFFP
jgi:membrane protease YdiL (CAAX protease family)